ncbi:MAG: hypothetical protein COT84_02705 [Chlamydiae bacterium CG10_big_fil_rev_8_21_14_0_10_35_9]|nr:MAG: hypothetical protein COT84_02705 [Chlamydiae bacterium CG10_big_fil_rev_8_21_14_0_10_35_9]
MEKACQYLNFSHAEIEKVCQQYFLNGRLQKFEILSGGAVNTTFKIYWDNDWYVLRFYVRDKNLASIEESVYRLVQNTVPIPEMLFASFEPYPFAIFRFCRQPHIYDVNKKYSQRLSYDLGAVLAKIHSFCFPSAGLFGKHLTITTLFEKGSSPYFEYCLKHLTPGSHVWNHLGEAQSKQVIHFIEKHKDYFPTIRNRGCLVHSDFKPVNLLWDEKLGLTVLDWEFAHSGDKIIDFGILLRHYQDFPLDISYLEKGYKDNGGQLVVDWVQRARITDFINIIQLLNTSLVQPQLFQSLISSLNFTILNWNELRPVLEES